ncbi:13230_t:CDS:2 [Funneliformis geosporum]|uniref:7343_t:CDS:1 n=1 Tax=Funneliformis geosporum TaxID=1117311 RepID=A0A9W4SMK3_9GLOM|nr:7343_t:CDS:2 [Funneliformis geosporum]CAI2179085.1 13230_t:CDS:2 [Funneliformis geosporum]
MRYLWCAVVLYFTLVQVVYGQTNYCIKEVDYCFTITLSPKTVHKHDQIAQFRLEVPSDAGWVGLGLGNGMKGYLMVAWVDPLGQIILSQRRADIGIQPYITNRQNDLQLLNTSGINENNKLIIEFTRPIKVKGSNIKRQKQKFAYAYSSISPASSEVNAYLNRHDHKGEIILKLDGTGKGEIVWSRYDKMMIAHGSLMFAAWLVIIPGAIFIARFAKDILRTTWFKLHVGIQIFLSFPIIVTGSVLTYVAVGKLEFNDPHKVIGFLLLLGLFIQLAIGAVHHKLFDPNRAYVPWWTKLHWWFGRALVLLAIIQIPFGLKLYGAKKIYLYIYLVYLFILMVAFSFLSFRLWNKSRDQKDNGFKQIFASFLSFRLWNTSCCKKDDGFKQMQENEEKASL